MKTTSPTVGIGVSWPPEEGQLITFNSTDSVRSGVLKEVRWGLVWRDFILDDGRVIAEHKVLGCPEPPAWRNADEVSQDEREVWEERLASMAAAGIDPRDREQAFWAELNQYLAYIYLKVQSNRA
jgi:hypothetical protein